MFHENVKRFKSNVNVRSKEFQERYAAMSEIIKEFEEKLEECLWQGKESHVNRHIKAGRLLGLFIIKI